MTPATASRRYLTAFVPAMLFYTAAILAMPTLVAKAGHSQALLALFAVLPAAPILVVIFVAGRFLMETDEGQRALQTKRMMFALGGTLAACTVYGFLEAYAGLPHIELFYVFPLYCALWIAASVVVRSAA